MGQVLETLPLTISPVTIDLLEVTNEQILVRWTDPLASQTGGTSVPILNYLIEVSEEGGAFVELPQILFGTN